MEVYTIIRRFGDGIDQRRYDTVDLSAIIAKFNCIPMESRDAKWQ